MQLTSTVPWLASFNADSKGHPLQTAPAAGDLPFHRRLGKAKASAMYLPCHLLRCQRAPTKRDPSFETPFPLLAPPDPGCRGPPRQHTKPAGRAPAAAPRPSDSLSRARGPGLGFLFPMAQPSTARRCSARTSRTDTDTPAAAPRSHRPGNRPGTPQRSVGEE